MEFRTSDWPGDPAPVVGEPLVEYVTRQELLARGWTDLVHLRVVGGAGWDVAFGMGIVRYYYFGATASSRPSRDGGRRTLLRQSTRGLWR